jgi:major membrane immunogen (membrane-anchored lipoprotein)
MSCGLPDKKSIIGWLCLISLLTACIKTELLSNVFEMKPSALRDGTVQLLYRAFLGRGGD